MYLIEAWKLSINMKKKYLKHDLNLHQTIFIAIIWEREINQNYLFIIINLKNLNHWLTFLKLNLKLKLKL
jgi:hypothetical protein